MTEIHKCQPDWLNAYSSGCVSGPFLFRQLRFFKYSVTTRKKSHFQFKLPTLSLDFSFRVMEYKQGPLPREMPSMSKNNPG